LRCCASTPSIASQKLRAHVDFGARSLVRGQQKECPAGNRCCIFTDGLQVAPELEAMFAIDGHGQSNNVHTSYRLDTSGRDEQRPRRRATKQLNGDNKSQRDTVNRYAGAVTKGRRSDVVRDGRGVAALQPCSWPIRDRPNRPAGVSDRRQARLARTPCKTGERRNQQLL